MKKAKHWYDYLWICAILYFTLGFFNILFAWLGMIDFLLPLFLAIFGGNKFFCNHLCGRGQLFSKLGTDLKCSRCKPTPRWMSSKWFRYGFLIMLPLCPPIASYVSQKTTPALRAARRCASERATTAGIVTKAPFALRLRSPTPINIISVCG